MCAQYRTPNEQDFTREHVVRPRPTPPPTTQLNDLFLKAHRKSFIYVSYIDSHISTKNKNENLFLSTLTCFFKLLIRGNLFIFEIMERIREKDEENIVTCVVQGELVFLTYYSFHDFIGKEKRICASHRMSTRRVKKRS